MPGPATIYTTGGPTGLSQIKYCSCGRLTIPDKGNNPSRVPIQTGSLTIPVRPTKLDTQTGSTNANPSSKQSNDPVRHNKTTTKLTHRGPLYAGPSVQNHHLAGFNGASNNIKSLKGCKATTSNYSGATQLTQQHNLQVKLATSNISGTQVPEEPSSRRHIQVPSSLMAIYEHKLTTVEHKQLHSQLDNF